MNFFFDSFTLLMLLLIILIGFTVLIFSQNYLATDPFLIKFHSFIVLFLFFMYFVIAAENFMTLLLGWEGVGLCSFLLISFWNTRILACKSAFKAIFINRISDCFFIIGIIFIYLNINCLDFLSLEVLTPIEQYNTNNIFMNLNVLDIIGFFIIIGAFGKSAQYGFHVWLPDAMEGPTPISALIHAATMVTLGVFLLIRCNFILHYSFVIQQIILNIGLCTIILASFLGLNQNDLKKIIAYSTCSHLGFMFVACGIAEYELAFFHLWNHGCFKALLFLCAGNIIHAQAKLQDQDLDEISIDAEVSVSLPITTMFLDFSISSLNAIVWTSGCLSKEEIIDIIQYKTEILHPYVFLLLMGAYSSIFYCDIMLESIDEDESLYESTTSSAYSSETQNKYIIIVLTVLSFFAMFGGYLSNIIYYSSHFLQILII